jgi:hypothetical protein
MVTDAEAELDARLAERDLTGTGGNGSLKKACLDIVKIALIERGMISGTMPDSLSLGDMSKATDWSEKVAMLEADISRQIDLFQRSAKGSAYSGQELSTRRADAQMGNYHLDQTIVHEYSDEAEDYSVNDPTDLEV